MSVQEAIAALQAISPTLVVLPSTDDYDELAKSYLSALARDLSPACFAVPSSPAEVSAAVKALRPFAGSVPLSVCGAGQQPAPGVSNARDGVTIHLRDIKGVEISGDKETVKIGAGELWGNVYEKVGAEGLAVSGSRTARGGVGGLSLHGGLSPFSAARGFIADDVAAYEVVLASGDVVTASANENADLFRALKGGGNNFGVVTRVDVRAFEQGDMWGGRVFYFPNSFPGQLSALVDFLHGEADPRAHLQFNIGYATAFGAVMCKNDMWYSEPEKPECLKPFTDIQPQLDNLNSLGVSSLAELTGQQASGASYMSTNRTAYITTTVKADLAILQHATDTFLAAIDSVKTAAGLTYALCFEAYPVSLLEQSATKGPNSLGLDSSAGPLVLLLLFASWADAGDDEKVLGPSRRVVADIEAEAGRTGVGVPYRFMNYADVKQDPVASYGEESRRHLRAVSKKVDPEGFFQKAVGGFKLS